MATLKTLFACLAANQLDLATPAGRGILHAVAITPSGPAFSVDLAHTTEQYTAEQLFPVLKGFVAFRTAAMRNDAVPLQALGMIAQAVASINVHGKHLYAPMPAIQAIDAPLISLNPKAVGYGRLDWQLRPYWNPTGGEDGRQWQPVAVPGLAHFLLCHGYAAELPATDWITEPGAKIFELPSAN